MESMKRLTREWRPSTTAESRHLAQALATIEQDSMRYKNMKTKPWLDAEGKMLWSPLQIRLAKIIFSQSFETLMGLIIFGNIFLIVYETNADAGCHPEFSGELHNCPTGSNASIWSWVANVALQVIYTAECLARMFVERSNFVRNRWNLIDLFIVLVGWLGMGLSEMVSFNVVRIFRVVRLLRAGRLLLSVPELYILLNGLTTSFKAIFFGSILLIAVVFVWAIVTVELLHPVNVELGYDATCPKCAEGFQTVYRASLTLFSQVVAGDNWGAISLPLAERHPWTAPILFGICMTISLGVMNLILAVIVEKAAESRQNDLDRKVEEKNMEREKTMVELAMLCDRMDKDHSGSLSLEEMMNGYVHEKKFFALMQGAGIEKNDLETIFNVMDTDNSGEVDYVEFCSEVGQCHKRDPMMLASMTRYSLLELRKMIHQEVMETLQMQTQMLREQLDLLAHVPGCEKEAAKLRQRRILAQGSSVGHLKASDSFQAIEHKLSSLEVWASQIKEVWHGSEDGAPSDSSARSRDVGHDWKEIDEQLRDLDSRFNVRIQVEAALRQRCQEMMEKLTGDVQANLLVSDIY